MTDGVLGLTYTLSAGGNVLGGGTAVNFTLNGNPVEVTSRDGAGSVERIGGLLDYTIDEDMILLEDDAAYLALEAALIAKTQVATILTTPAGKTYAGNSVVDSLGHAAPVGDKVTCAISLSKGKGALTITEPA